MKDYDKEKNHLIINIVMKIIYMAGQCRKNFQ